MTQPWNLTPEEWSKVLQTDEEAQRAAARVRTDHTFPWTQTLLSLTRDCSSSLDMGSGRGELSAVMAKNGKKATLLEWSEKNVDFSKRLFKELGLNADFHRCDMTQPLPFEDGQFDVVYSCGVFEYFTDEQIRQILSEAFRVAKKRVIIMVPNAWSLPYRFGKWYMEAKKKWVWGGERPFASLKPYFRVVSNGRLREFSVGTHLSLDFLTMRGGSFMQKILKATFRLKDHSDPSRLNQGYLLITVGEKV